MGAMHADAGPAAHAHAIDERYGRLDEALQRPVMLILLPVEADACILVAITRTIYCLDIPARAERPIIMGALDHAVDVRVLRPSVEVRLHLADHLQR
jgi:hypothetical protein